MKTIKYIVAYSMFAMLFFTCDELEELLEEDIEVNISFQGNLEVESETLANPEESVQINSEGASYNIADDPEIAELLESGTGTGEIKKIEITQIRYLFQNFEGNTDANVVGAIQIITPNMFFQGFETVQTNLAIADENNTLFTIDGDFTEINESITDTESLIVLFAGSASDNPVEFEVDVTVFVKVTITPPDL